MKKILLFILAVIILIFGYSQYKEYQRFHPENANIKASENIDLNYHSQETVYNYYDALEAVNNYMQMQWSANSIDVRSPENDDAETTLAVLEYGRKVAKANYYKAILEASKTFKNKGLTNEEIKLFEIKGVSITEHNKEEMSLKEKQLLLNMMPQKALYSGEKSAFIYEMQKLLVKKGYDISVDGVYQTITSEALKGFEEKNNLFPDGKIDLKTLDLLLK
ncbi:peptidoglycan-binding protein [Lacinutrix sp. Bg11-31]|uniref:peptidoglycan-binding domain-containing protein n=1 Tax=Lacinutrix sp. Bg11-31 TaxID=2057808 RepID=UPI000C301D5E|nr:peptidoglycan-binding domain-containing protein [Lacinutrix sp. Bg11-31]AUC83053.1 peptidoglycan-binding protein [Lacinutrix sp. Bg11-31]